MAPTDTRADSDEQFHRDQVDLCWPAFEDKCGQVLACTRARTHVCTDLCVCVCASSQFKLASLPHFLSFPPSFHSLLLLPLFFFQTISPTPMNRLNFLMSCFYGLLMLIRSSPYAPLFHSSISVSPSAHSSHPPPPLTPGFPAATMFSSAGSSKHMPSDSQPP